jgi:hypothetical protein
LGTAIFVSTSDFQINSQPHGIAIYSFSVGAGFAHMAISSGNNLKFKV